MMEQNADLLITHIEKAFDSVVWASDELRRGYCCEYQGTEVAKLALYQLLKRAVDLMDDVKRLKQAVESDSRRGEP